jgi:hypothetical protein
MRIQKKIHFKIRPNSHPNDTVLVFNSSEKKNHIKPTQGILKKKQCGDINQNKSCFVLISNDRQEYNDREKKISLPL